MLRLMRSLRKACSWKDFKFLLITILELHLSSLALLTQARRQWSLMPSAKTAEAVVLSFLLDRIKSINVDFEWSFKSGLVGSSLSCDGLRLPHISFRLFKSLANQFRLQSPRTSISELLYWAIKTAHLLIALETAESCLYTPTTLI